MEEIYKKNEFETNEIVSLAIRILLLFIFLAGIFCWLRIFDVYNFMINGFILASFIPLIVPTILVNILHINKSWVKYILILCVTLVTGIAYVVFTFQTVIIFVIPAILATFYLDKEVMGFTAVITSMTIYVSHVITGIHLFQPWLDPFTDMRSILLYGALPRLLQFLCCMTLLWILSFRYSKFINSFYKVLQEEKNQDGKDKNYNIQHSDILEVTGLLTEREKEVFEFMAKGFTNAQIAKQLCLSNGTVKNYVSVIYDKIGIKDRTAIVLKYSSYYHTHD